MSMFQRIANAWWKWRTRCKKVRLDPMEIRNVVEAGIYAWCLMRHFEPCKVCGERTCRWATQRMIRDAVPGTGEADETKG